MRCKSCNQVLEEHEIIWDEERKEHEELCTSCRSKVFEAMQDEDYVTLSEEE